MFMEVLACRALKHHRGAACCAPVAQMDRALASGAKGRGFESLLARHSFLVQPKHIGYRTYRLHKQQLWTERIRSNPALLVPCAV
jgi:hypothetical protein